MSRLITVQIIRFFSTLHSDTYLLILFAARPLKYTTTRGQIARFSLSLFTLAHLLEWLIAEPLTLLFILKFLVSFQLLTCPQFVWTERVVAVSVKRSFNYIRDEYMVHSLYWDGRSQIAFINALRFKCWRHLNNLIVSHKNSALCSLRT